MWTLPEVDLVQVPAAPQHEVWLLPAVAAPWLAMQAAARVDGLGLVACSGFRSVARQTAIWNRKWDAARADGLDAAQ
ncbi:MAG: D-alanyl-D-alanine carboxypeptidase family protein, partial [Rhodocyclaceae bacterium]|nr:D-alanyl-D-alanine carboxypeptidase family protein [Rhodocyclaceae bacterium]